MILFEECLVIIPFFEIEIFFRMKFHQFLSYKYFYHILKEIICKFSFCKRKQYLEIKVLTQS